MSINLSIVLCGLTLMLLGQLLSYIIVVIIQLPSRSLPLIAQAEIRVEGQYLDLFLNIHHDLLF